MYCDRANSQEVGSVVALEYTQRGKQVYLGLSSFPGLAQLSISCGESLGMRSQEHKGLLQALDSTQALGLRVVSSCIESTQMARTSQEYRRAWVTN